LEIKNKKEKILTEKKRKKIFTRIFAGFTSLCTIPSLCRYCKAFAAEK
jgi:hypothetical protein